MRLSLGTGPQTLESHDCVRLSPMTKYSLGASVRRGYVWKSSRSVRTYDDSSSRCPLTKTFPLRCSHVSPGSAITLLTNMPAGGQCCAARGGVSKTTMSPRFGSRPNSRTATTWSDDPAVQPGAGRAQRRVGSIAEVGMRYAFNDTSAVAMSSTAITASSGANRIQSGWRLTAPHRTPRSAPGYVSPRVLIPSKNSATACRDSGWSRLSR
jgi:hypothetical protein